MRLRAYLGTLELQAIFSTKDRGAQVLTGVEVKGRGVRGAVVPGIKPLTLPLSQREKEKAEFFYVLDIFLRSLQSLFLLYLLHDELLHVQILYP